MEERNVSDAGNGAAAARLPFDHGVRRADMGALAGWNPAALDVCQLIAYSYRGRGIFDRCSDRDSARLGDALCCAMLEHGASIYASFVSDRAIYLVAEISFSSMEDLFERILILYGVQKRQDLNDAEPLFDTPVWIRTGRSERDLLRFVSQAQCLCSGGSEHEWKALDDELDSSTKPVDWGVAQDRCCGLVTPLGAERWLSLGRLCALFDVASAAEQARYRRWIPVVSAQERRWTLSQQPPHALRPETWQPLSLAAALVAFHAVRETVGTCEAVASRLALSAVELREAIEHFRLWYPECFERPLSDAQLQQLAGWWSA